MTISVSILETGTIRIRPSHRTQPATKNVGLRRLTVFTDRAWTEPLPINTYLISHPEGYILFDTGESPQTMQPGYFPSWSPFFHLAVDIHVREHEGIRARLNQHGISPSDLQAVVISHLHHDHGDGIADLDGADIFVSPEHWDAFKSPYHATMEGAVPSQWPKGFVPKLLERTGGPVGPWNSSYPITKDGKVIAVDTPGHVPGHICLIVYGDDATYLLGGDSTYDQDLLDREQTDGVNGNPLLAVESLKKIKKFASQEPIVILPAHDPDAAHRLALNEIYVPGYTAGTTPRECPQGHNWLLIWLLALGTIFIYRMRRR
ncbi:beta-lactamase-like protein [Penicillium cataractarum]|uniref:Beta-lactamase-like protein n=1 Tax=Penicillium cataractarum TaxID=2100454 RepID=A0A9W9V9L5_9EURO|nr:beta-lactamase-like protein [Penicillium cataractarum]KAJ5371336.1 beta-lactamase-like protein [Penicillium cataractarum]